MSSAFLPSNWRMSFVPHPAELPELFLDRNLGRIKVPLVQISKRLSGTVF